MIKVLFITILLLTFFVGCDVEDKKETNVNEEEYIEQEYIEEECSESYLKGKELADKLNEEMESIDWEENYDKAEEKGKEAAEYLNSLFGGN